MQILRLRLFSVTRLIALFGLVLSGCNHALEIKNLSQYRPSSINPMNQRVSIGIVSTEEDPQMKHLIKCIGGELQKYSSEVILPYTPGASKKVDVLAHVRVTPEYKGAGTNFFVNFPGFLVFAPAWHGYNYTVKYNIAVDLMTAKKNEKIDQFTVPVELQIRHAEMDRTWTEISWLEVGVIALIGGVYCINYDPDVTPLVTEKAGLVLGENIAGEIVNRLNGSGKFGMIERLYHDESRLASLFGNWVDRL